jgi:hypothetical protein
MAIWVAADSIPLPPPKQKARVVIRAGLSQKGEMKKVTPDEIISLLL